jgi:uncharacterized membrane protein YjjP (DUF1212 family)
MDSSKEIIKATNLLLEIASLLMVSGANTIRVNLTINRFADCLNLQSSCFISHKSIIMTLYDENSNLSCTRVKNIPAQAINFNIISEISKISWDTLSKTWTLDQISKEIENIKNKKRYSKLFVLVAVSLAGAGFCNIFQGDYLNMTVAFISTFIGLLVFKFTHKQKFNVYMRIFLASFIASLIAGFGVLYNIGTFPQSALATSILFLVPGVALINSFTDLLDNHIINGMVRFTSGLMTVLAIALGLFITMLIFQLN